MNDISEAPQNSLITRTEQLEGILTIQEINALNRRTSLNFSVSNLSYQPTRKHKELARELANHNPDLNFAWHHAPVQATFTLSYYDSSIMGRIEILRIKEDAKDETAKYLGSATRPPTMIKSQLHLMQALPREVNIAHRGSQVWMPGISFYTKESDYLSNNLNVFWSLHCLRESRIDR